MITVSASAPGKIVVCGEYAVLHGAHALGMAVDRRVRVTVEPSALQHWSVSTITSASSNHHFQIGREGSVEWGSDEGLRLVEAVLDEFDTSELAPCHINIDSSSLFQQSKGRKLGLG